MQLSFNVNLGVNTLSKSAFIAKTMNTADYNRYLNRVAQRTYDLALTYTPVKTGTLKSSAQLYSQPGYHVIVFETPYAGYVHEMHLKYGGDVEHGFLMRAFTDIMMILDIEADYKAPDFSIRFGVTPEGYVELRIIADKNGKRDNKFSWRRWM